MARWGGGKGFRMLAHVGCKGKNRHIKIMMSGQALPVAARRLTILAIPANRRAEGAWLLHPLGGRTYLESQERTFNGDPI